MLNLPTNITIKIRFIDDCFYFMLSLYFIILFSVFINLFEYIFNFDYLSGKIDTFSKKWFKAKKLKMIINIK